MVDENGSASGDGIAPVLCAICRLRPQSEKYRPFCSKRCADIDLHRWLGGVYAIPAEPDDDEAEQLPPEGEG